MIKKTCATVLVLAVMTCGANANIIFNFAMPGGFSWESGPAFLAAMINPGQSATIQFNYAPDGTPDAVGIGGTLLGDDINIATWTIMSGGTLANPDGGRGSSTLDDNGWFLLNEDPTSAGATLTPWDAGAGNDGSISGGAFYGHVFQDSSIGVGDYYYTGPTASSAGFVIDPTDPMAVPNTYELVRYGTTEDQGNGEGFIDSFATGTGFGGQVVPEPGTWALFAMGILTLAGVKLRSRK